MNPASMSSIQRSLLSSSPIRKSTTKFDISESCTENNGDGIDPIDLEGLIQSDRIANILMGAIHKTKLALCLPRLVKQEYGELRSTLNERDFNELVYLFQHYNSPLVSTSLRNFWALQNIIHGDFTLRQRLNLDMTQVTSILTKYPTLSPLVEKILNKMKLTQYFSQDRSSIEYLLSLEQFLELLKRQMNTKAAEDLEAKLQMQKLIKLHNTLIPQIKELRRSLKQEQTEFEVIFNIKTSLIKKLKKELSFLDHGADSEFKKKVLDSDRQMVLASRAHEKKIGILKQEEVEFREKYENSLMKHLDDEKSLRARRFKVETQLLTWIQKYDIEMSEKRAQLDDLTEKYVDETKKCEELKEKLTEQDKEYIPLMKERNDEYHAEMTAKADEFSVDHAARVLQTAYQQILVNRKDKEVMRKKLKLLKKKQELEERRAEKEQKAATKAAAGKKLKSGGKNK